MTYLIAKALISALIIVAVSELSWRSSVAGALLASLPLWRSSSRLPRCSATYVAMTAVLRTFHIKL
jgi:hypothetical protein